jgi:hypothetical protein
VSESEDEGCSECSFEDYEDGMSHFREVFEEYAYGRGTLFRNELMSILRTFTGDYSRLYCSH